MSSYHVEAITINFVNATMNHQHQHRAMDKSKIFHPHKATTNITMSNERECD
jgi:hypothetical protein